MARQTLASRRFQGFRFDFDDRDDEVLSGGQLLGSFGFFEGNDPAGLLGKPFASDGFDVATG